MAKRIFVHFLPELTSPEALSGGIVVVIDILRASTTIVEAMAAGAASVIPFLEIPQARAEGEKRTPGSFLLGGERGGVRIDGFHLGNSPAEYTAEKVSGKTILFTTTNGTKALAQCALAERVFIGAFTNLSSLTERMATYCDSDWHLLCAGTDGCITCEDVLFAGAAVERLQILADKTGGKRTLDDQARLALDAWQSVKASGEMLEEQLSRSRGGENLLALGMKSDIAWGATIDRHHLVPEYDIAQGCITRGASP